MPPLFLSPWTLMKLFFLIMYLVYGAEGVLTVDEAILKDGVPSRDLPEEPR